MKKKKIADVEGGKKKKEMRKETVKRRNRQRDHNQKPRIMKIRCISHTMRTGAALHPTAAASRPLPSVPASIPSAWQYPDHLILSDITSPTGTIRTNSNRSMISICIRTIIGTLSKHIAPAAAPDVSVPASVPSGRPMPYQHRYHQQ